MTSFVFPPFDEKVDYPELNRHFERKYGIETLTSVIRDSDRIDEIHRHERLMWVDRNPRSHYLDWCCNLRRLRRMEELSTQIQLFNSLNAREANLADFAFITIGWNEQVITPDKMLKLSLKIFGLKYFSFVNMVLEKHRANGIHHHTHLLVKFVNKEPPSKIVGWIFQSKDIQKFVLAKNFIDYKGVGKKEPCASFDTYHNYVRGIKQEEKIPYVKLDRIWREENHIKHLYER